MLVYLKVLCYLCGCQLVSAWEPSLLVMLNVCFFDSVMVRLGSVLISLLSLRGLFGYGLYQVGGLLGSLYL